MTLTEFATKHRLRIRKGEFGESIIPGRPGESHIFEYGDEDGRLGVVFMPLARGRFPASFGGVTRRWNKVKTELLAVGMELTQDGDYEGCALFDGRNATQAKIAIRVAGARKKKRMSPEHMAKLAAANREHRFKAGAHGTGTPSGDSRNASWAANG